MKREECLKNKRKLTRAKKNSIEDIVNNLETTYKTSKSELKKLIKESKQKEWDKLCNEAELDIWGKGYKIVNKKLGNLSPVKLNEAQFIQIANKLFIKKDEQDFTYNNIDNPIEITTEEILEANQEINCNKAPGPDGIPPFIIKFFVNLAPEIVLQLFNNLINSDQFLDNWKVAKLILIPKHGKNMDKPSDFRPICLLNVLNKLFEKIILKKILVEFNTNGGFSNNQFGFRKGLSTFDAIDKITQTSKLEMKKTSRSRNLSLLILFDIRNAFNSADWKIIIQNLEKKHIKLFN